MAGKVKTWVWIAVAVVVIGILGIVALAGVGLYYFSQHIDTKQSTPAAAAHEFEQIRGRLGAQPPLIELDSRGRLVRSNTKRPPPTNRGKPDELHVLAFDPDSERIVNVTVPFWLLRLKMGNTRIQIGDRNVDLEELNLSIEDLERYGPALIVDHKSREGERVLIWSQ